MIFPYKIPLLGLVKGITGVSDKDIRVSEERHCEKENSLSTTEKRSSLLRTKGDPIKKLPHPIGNE